MHIRKNYISSKAFVYAVVKIAGRGRRKVISLASLRYCLKNFPTFSVGINKVLFALNVTSFGLVANFPSVQNGIALFPFVCQNVSLSNGTLLLEGDTVIGTTTLSIHILSDDTLWFLNRTLLLKAQKKGKDKENIIMYKKNNNFMF